MNKIQTVDGAKKKKNRSVEIAYSINEDCEISLFTKKQLHLRDLRHQQEKLNKEHANAKKLLQDKQVHFSLKEKIHNEEQEKIMKEYEQAIKDNQDRQIILKDKIQNKEKKIKFFDAEIKKYKIIIEKLHEQIKKANYDIEIREKNLTFLTKFKNESIEFVQLDMFDRLETIFNSEQLIQKKKKKLTDKIDSIRAEIKNLEEKSNTMLRNKEKEYKDLVKLSEEVIEKRKAVEEKLKENINENNQNNLLLTKIISSIDNLLSRFLTFLPELRHYNIKKNEEKLLEKKNKSNEEFDKSYFISMIELNNLEQEIVKKMDIIYKYIKDTIYIIEKVKKGVFLKNENILESKKGYADENIEFFTYNGKVKGKNS